MCSSSGCGLLKREDIYLNGHSDSQEASRIKRQSICVFARLFYRIGQDY